MAERHIDTDGAKALVHAIVLQAKIDVLNSRPGSYVRMDAENFFLSDFFEELTGLEGGPVLRILHKQYDRKHNKRKGRMKS